MIYVLKQPAMLEAKTILTALFYIFGVPATIAGILLNMGTWKADILFILSAVLIVIKIFYIIREKNQKSRDKEMDLERKRLELDRFKGL